MMDQLSHLNGPEFDREVQQHAVKAHEKAIKLFQNEAVAGQDPDLKAFAQKTLPVLQQHLAMARQLNAGTTIRRSTLNQ
jgi:putative membrane protein